MSRFNHGMIFTNDNCVGCNKCISGCPVIGANISLLSDGKNRIEVDERKCIHCGHCLNVCTHGAREYIDDTPRFFDDLKSGVPVSLAVAPSFYLLYKENAASILGYLKSLGVRKIYDVAFGADISTWAHINYIHTHRDENGRCPAYIAQSCPAIINFAERCAPEMIPRLVPVQSPVICLGIYVHKYLGDASKLAFLSPCITKKDELDSPSTGGNIDYNVTFRHLFKRLESVDTTGFYAKSDLVSCGFGGMFPMPGGFKEYFDYFASPGEVVLRAENTCMRHKEIMRQLEGFERSGEHPVLFDMLNCEYGCLTGSAADTPEYDIAGITSGYRDIRSGFSQSGISEGVTPEQKLRRLNETFSMLNPDDFSRSFEEKYRQQFKIPEGTLDEIFNAMHKTTPLLRSLDCSSCGYASCREMVTAIAYGYNRKENCIHFAKEEITRLYYADPLTGISNGFAFERDAAALIKSNPGTTYIIDTVDVNNFKVINDLYGFEQGDAILRYLAQKAVAFTKGSGVCARTDSDRFAVCFPYTEERLSLLQSYEFYDCTDFGIDTPLTLRHGMYIVDDADKPINRILDLAAIAQDSISDRSRNSFAFYNETLRSTLLLEAQITSQMRDALANGEFIAYLQPQFNHSTCALVGAEMLCRWLKPDGSIISPGVFIPIFEKNGFIRSLDRHMWKLAFELMRKWLDMGVDPVPVSINISRLSMLDSDMFGVIGVLRRRYDVPAWLIHLEITESAYMQNQKQLIERARQLREDGFLIAMDDFGSGYSSLNTLKDVPFDILKLDMGFFKNEGDAAKGGNIISSMIRMAQNLKLTTIAEGVEAASQADFLKSVGCDVIQGFLYARPMPVSQFEEMLRASKLCHTVERPRMLESIDLNSFYNPESGETKMFDHYTGAAIVFEYEQGEMSIIRINDKYLRELGLSKERFEALRVKFLGSLLPESAEALEKAINAAIETGKEATCLTRRDLPGSDEPLWIKSHLWRVASHGSRHTLYGLAENVSAEKNSELKLIKANQRMELIMENSPAGILLFKGRVVNTPMGKNLMLKPITVNRFFLDWTGYTREEVLGWSELEALGVVHPLDMPAFAINMHRALETTFNFSQVYRARKKNGEYEWVKLIAAAVPENDGSFWLVSNITNYESDKITDHNKKFLSKAKKPQ